MTLPQDKKNLCGYGRFTLPEDHPFTPICVLEHDAAYEAYLNGFPTRPLSEADSAMFTAMLGVARERRSLSLRAQAYAFYGITTIFRLMFRS